MGTVEHIGVKTTRLRSLNGEELIFSNTDLTSARISNYKTLEKRRILFQIGVTYDTSINMLRKSRGSSGRSSKRYRGLNSGGPISSPTTTPVSILRLSILFSAEITTSTWTFTSR